MFYEKLNYHTDANQLKHELSSISSTLGKFKIQGEEHNADAQYSGFGGWSLQSYSGDWRDGWEIMHVINDPRMNTIFFPDGLPNYKAFKYIGVVHPFEHTKYTNACTPYIRKILEDLASLGFYPRRARLTCLKAHSKSALHKDTVFNSSDNDYMARIHIPIITNEKCTHSADGVQAHFPADGSVYMMWVNNWHQIINDSDEDRYHIIMDAWDTKGITEQFKYDGDMSVLEKEASMLRDNINRVTISDNEMSLFKKLEQQYLRDNGYA